MRMSRAWSGASPANVRSGQPRFSLIRYAASTRSRHPRSPSFHRQRALLAIALLIALVFAGQSGTARADAATASTVITLTFDDGWASTRHAEQTMAELGIAGTFYIVDTWIDAPGYFTRGDLDRFAAHGHEIGGHTSTHPALSEVSAAEQKREVCNNRATLESWGFHPVSFAYPYASYDEHTSAIVAECGYHTARGLGSVRAPGDCPDCVTGETTRPADPMWIRAPSQISTGWTLEQLQNQVVQASGGWLVLTFHHICDPVARAKCPAEAAITPAVFDAFADWLSTYTADPRNRAVTRTMDQQTRAGMGRTTRRTPQPCRAPHPPISPPGVNMLANADLTRTDPATGTPLCFDRTGWGNNTAEYARVPPGPSGMWTERIEITEYADGDAKLMPRMDLGECTPTVIPGARYELSTLYRSSADTKFALYYRSADGRWHYWTSGPTVPPSTLWRTATFTTPPVPAEANGMSFGLGLIGDGVLWVDDYSLVHRLDPPSAPKE